MDSKELIQKLDLLYKDFDTNKKQYRILIDGKWGIGKSFTVKQLFKNKRNNQYFISLFGLKSLEELEKFLIKKVLFPTVEKLNKSNILKVTGNLFGQITDKSPIKIPNVKNLIDVLTIEDLNFSKNSIVCIDDLERVNNKIDFKELLGLFERISTKTNLIMICNLEKLKEPDENKDSKNKNRYEIFKEYQEKVLDSKFKITEISKKTLNDFLKNQDWNEEEIKVLKILFNKYGECNLRILEKIKVFYREINIFYKPDFFSIEDKKLILESIFYVILEDCTKFFKTKYINSVEYKKNIMSENNQKIESKKSAKEVDKTDYFKILPLKIQELVECINEFYLSKNVIKEKIEIVLQNIEHSEIKYKVVERCKNSFLETKDTIKELHLEINSLIKNKQIFKLMDLAYLYMTLLEIKKYYNLEISHETDKNIKQLAIELTTIQEGKLSLTAFEYVASARHEVLEKINEMIEEAYDVYQENLKLKVEKAVHSLDEDLLNKIYEKNIRIGVTSNIIDFFMKFKTKKIDINFYYVMCSLYRLLNADAKKEIDTLLKDHDSNDFFIEKRIEYISTFK